MIGQLILPTIHRLTLIDVAQITTFEENLGNKDDESDLARAPILT
jgi:hypothetical protein